MLLNTFFLSTSTASGTTNAWLPDWFSSATPLDSDADEQQIVDLTGEQADDERRRSGNPLMVTSCNSDWDCLIHVEDGATIPWDFPGKCINRRCRPFSWDDWGTPTKPKGCAYDLKTCPDGTQVGRDINNNCAFKPCLKRVPTCGGHNGHIFGTCEDPDTYCAWKFPGYVCVAKHGFGGRRRIAEDSRRRIKKRPVMKGTGHSCSSDNFCKSNWLLAGWRNKHGDLTCQNFEGQRQCVYVTIETTGTDVVFPRSGEIGDRCSYNAHCRWGLEYLAPSLNTWPGRRLDEGEVGQAPEPEFDDMSEN